MAKPGFEWRFAYKSSGPTFTKIRPTAHIKPNAPKRNHIKLSCSMAFHKTKENLRRIPDNSNIRNNCSLTPIFLTPIFHIF